MAIDETTVKTELRPEPEPDSTGGAKFVVVFIVLAILAIGEVFTVSRMNSVRDQLTTQQNQLRDDLTGQMREQISSRLTAIEQQNAQELDAVKTELDDAAKRVGAQGHELKRARTMVADLQNQQQAQTEQLKQELAQKADAQQVGALSQDVSSTKTDLNATKSNVNTLASDLGMARSEMGTLIARNHDDIEYLRKLGDRDYFEFTLTRDQPAKVAGVGLTLKKTNLKHYRFNVATLADDMEVERKDCTINAPVYFYVNGSKKPYELVVNRVDSNQVKGYLSTPKGVTEVALRSEGAH
jgi:FKBP-type peptidyl-prolyl cis-trans isomerase